MNWMILGIGIILLMSGCAGQKQVGDLEQPSTMEKGIFAQHAAKNNQTLEESEKFFSQVYGLEEENQIFDLLEEKPENYEQEKSWLYDGNSESAGWISRATYERPEFHPTFETSGIAAWTNAPATPGVSVGLLATPSQQETVLEAGGEFETYLFVSASWGVTERQVGRMQYEVSEGADITLDMNPNPFILGKSFPQFEKGWVERIQIAGKVGAGVGPGTYRIVLRAGPPLEEDEWNHQTHRPVETMFSPQEGLAVLTIHVRN